MLTRILEPEVMDSPEEARDYDSMDHGEVNRRFVDDLLAAFVQQAGGHKAELDRPFNVLDLGTGTAQIPIELCRRSERFNVLAVDAAVHMLEVARRNIAAAGLGNRIRLAQVDAKRLPFPNAGYNCVMSNSIIHHLSEPILCLREAVRVARPGGLLFFRDLLRPATEFGLNQLVVCYAPNPDLSPAARHQREMFADSLRAALTLGEVRELIADLGFQPQTVQASSDQHWTWSAINESPTVGR